MACCDPQERESGAFGHSAPLLPVAERVLVVDASADGLVAVHCAPGRTASRVRGLALLGDTAPLSDSTLPLVLRLARAVLERSGGALTVVTPPAAPTTVIVRLPVAAERN